jgi:hypothetical protein
MSTAPVSVDFPPGLTSFGHDETAQPVVGIGLAHDDLAHESVASHEVHDAQRDVVIVPLARVDLHAGVFAKVVDLPVREAGFKAAVGQQVPSLRGGCGRGRRRILSEGGMEGVKEAASAQRRDAEKAPRFHNTKRTIFHGRSWEARLAIAVDGLIFPAKDERAPNVHAFFFLA